MKAVLLAAGRSQRMDPFADKNFLRMCGKPLIEWQIEMIARAGFREIAVVGGRHNLDALRKAVRDGCGARAACDECDITCLEQKNLEEGMAGAVLACEKWIGDEPFLVVSSNDIVEPSLFDALKRAMKTHRDAAGLIVAKRARSYFPGGYVKVGARGVIYGVVEKPGAGNEPSDLVNLVFHYHLAPKKLFAALKKMKNGRHDRDDRYEAALSMLMHDGNGGVRDNNGGAKFYAVPYEGAWQPVKYPWHLLEVWKMVFEERYFSAKISMKKNHRERGVTAQSAVISKKAVIAKSAVIRGDVVIEDGVKVFDHAVIQGPAYIGKNCVIANNALVRESHLGDNSVAGYSTEIARSFLDDGVWTHSNYIGDSIIGANSSFGSGTVTGNLRLDERTIAASAGESAAKIDTGLTKLGAIVGEGARIGINVSLMPGIRIGSNSFIGAGIAVAQDVPDGMFVTGKWELTMRENKVKLSPSARQTMMKKLTKSSGK